MHGHKRGLCKKSGLEREEFARAEAQSKTQLAKGHLYARPQMPRTPDLIRGKETASRIRKNGAPDEINLELILEEFQDWQDQLKPYEAELEELGL